MDVYVPEIEKKIRSDWKAASPRFFFMVDAGAGVKL
jgi:hypothetical protein